MNAAEPLDQAQAELGLAELYDEWLRDEAAQAEYQSYLASLNSTRPRREKELDK